MAATDRGVRPSGAIGAQVRRRFRHLPLVDHARMSPASVVPSPPYLHPALRFAALYTGGVNGNSCKSSRRGGSYRTRGFGRPGARETGELRELAATHEHV